MAIEGYYLLPHPPIVIPEVGKGEEEKYEILVIVWIPLLRKLRQMSRHYYYSKSSWPYVR